MLQQAIAYLHYLIKGKTRYYIHSPFVYELCEEVLYDARYFYAYDDIATVRKAYLRQHDFLSLTDFGAGARQGGIQSQVRISDLVKRVAVSEAQGELLFRLVNYFEPQYILELGTSLGISTMYMSCARKQSNIHTIEGSASVAALARNMFDKLHLYNVHIHIGEFSALLPSVLAKMPQIDMALLDGNHRYEPTIAYFEQILPLLHNNSVVIVDDIRWSSDMTKAWQYIKAHPRVRVTLDFFRFGLVFFRAEQAKEDFMLYF